MDRCHRHYIRLRIADNQCGRVSASARPSCYRLLGAKLSVEIAASDRHVASPETAQGGRVVACPATIEEARRKVAAYVSCYNHVRLHSAIRYITPADKLNGLASVIHAESDRKLVEARTRRAARESVA
ncbi:MAG: transposase [Planctomycetes bacterium]|nr:transposase [Planctomycetota bacterium]